MAYTVYYSNKDLTTQAGFGKVAHLPCIFDNRPGYHRLSSQYLIDRGLGLWSPKTRGGAQRVERPSAQTIKNYADWLANFLEWAEVRGVDLATCDYTEHLHDRYQAEMLKGIWSRDNSPLSPNTINPRVQQACDFLTWMADKGHREPFGIPTETVRRRFGRSTSSVGHRSHDVVVRKGKVRKNKRRLRMPTDVEVGAWLKRVYAEFGDAKGLMCEMVLLTALRREEVSCWRMDTLPEHRRDWHISNPLAPREDQRVLVEVKYGTKGTNYGEDHGDKVGPARSIWVPLVFAERLDEYRNKHRNAALKKWVKSAPTLAEQRERAKDTVHLFLDEETGERIKAKRLYEAWTGVDLPFDGWSPHLGRDWWACSTLWKEMKKHDHIRTLDASTATALLESTAMSIIRLQIQPQLGHAHDSTSMIYLQWIADMVGVNLSIRYDQDLDEAAA